MSTFCMPQYVAFLDETIKFDHIVSLAIKMDEFLLLLYRGIKMLRFFISFFEVKKVVLNTSTTTVWNGEVFMQV